jgi:hypothetical protein
MACCHNSLQQLLAIAHLAARNELPIKCYGHRMAMALAVGWPAGIVLSNFALISLDAGSYI